jgi:hypothetical protein
MLSHSRIIARTCGDSVTFREGGVSGRKHLSFGVGWLDSTSRSYLTRYSCIMTVPYQAPHLSRAPRTRNALSAHNTFPPSPASIDISRCHHPRSQRRPTFTDCTGGGLAALFGTEPEPCATTPWVLLLYGGEVYGEKERAFLSADRG